MLIFFQSSAKGVRIPVKTVAVYKSMNPLLPTSWTGCGSSLTRFIDYLSKPESRIVNFHIVIVYQKTQLGKNRIIQCINEEIGFEAMDLDTVEIWL